MKIKALWFVSLLMLISCLASAQQITRCGGPTNALYINWPTYSFDVCHTSYNPYETRINTSNVQTLTSLWSDAAHLSVDTPPLVDTINPPPLVYTINAPPALVNGVFYYVSYNQVFALDAIRSTILWKFTAGDQIYSSPTIAGGDLYIGSLDGNVYALNAATGAPLWKFTTGGPVGDSATVADGAVYIAGGGGLYAVNATTGALLWAHTGDLRFQGTPAVVDGLVFIGDGGNLVAVNAVNGVLLWGAQLSQGVLNSPAAFNGIVFAGGGPSQNFFALDAFTGATLWTLGNGTTASPVIAGGTIYVATLELSDNKPVVYALDAKTGQMLRTIPVNSQVDAMAVANGVLYAALNSGYIYALDANSGALLWNAAGLALDGFPIVANGTVYVTWYNRGFTSLGAAEAFYLPKQ